MARRLNMLFRFGRDFRRPPRWGMGLPPRRQRRPAGPARYVRLVVAGAALGLLSLAGCVEPSDQPSRWVAAAGECRVDYVVDGDTVGMVCPAGAERARLLGFDTPELFSPRCAAEHRRAEAAKDHLGRLIAAADEVAIVRSGTDRYGRALVSLYLDGEDAARAMIASGDARPYDGGRRRGWCA